MEFEKKCDDLTLKHVSALRNSVEQNLKMIALSLQLIFLDTCILKQFLT